MSLEALTREVGRCLEELRLAGDLADGRVSAVPDARTVRYYTTLKLIDRPKIVDREARYGRRHLMQLMAIKVLQRASLPLAEIQERLYGKGNAELESLLGTAAERTQERAPVIRAVRWREVQIESGLKILVEDHWSPKSDPAVLEKKIRVVLAAMQNGGRPL